MVWELQRLIRFRLPSTGRKNLLGAVRSEADILDFDTWVLTEDFHRSSAIAENRRKTKDERRDFTCGVPLYKARRRNHQKKRKLCCKFLRAMAEIVQQAWHRYLLNLQRYPLRTKVSPNCKATYSYGDWEFWESHDGDSWVLGVLSYVIAQMDAGGSILVRIHSFGVWGLPHKIL